MRINQRPSGRAVALAALAGVLLAGASATPALAAKAGPAGKDHCVLVLDPVRPGERESRVAVRSCAASTAAATSAVPASSTLLVWAYAGIYMGEPSTPIYGSAGPCDYDGYRINASGANSAVGGISSYRVYNSCIASAIDDGAGNAAGFCGDVNWVGSAVNDRVRYMSVWKGC
jgi:hypothetical protein